MIRRFLLALLLAGGVMAASATEYVKDGGFEAGNLSAWAMWNGSGDGATMTINADKARTGKGCLCVVNPLNETSNQWKVQIHTDFTEVLPEGEYELSYYICTASGSGSVRFSTSGEAYYQGDQNVSTRYTKKTFKFKSQGGVTGFCIDIGAKKNTYYIDDIELRVISQVMPVREVAVTVSPQTTYQAVEGIGGAYVYYQGWMFAHPYKTAILDTLFKGLHPSAVRFGNWKQNLGNSVTDDVNIVKEMNRRVGRDNYIIQMSSWTAPAELKANNSTGGYAPLKKGADGKFMYKEFAEWWRKSIEAYQKAGIEPDYISMQNEPDMKADYEATLFSPSENNSEGNSGYKEALPYLYAALNELEKRPKIIGPEGLGIGYNNIQNYMSQLNQKYLDGVCFHYYHGDNGAGDRYANADGFIDNMKALAKAYPKLPQFMTENCSMREVRSDDDISTAWLIANAFNYNNVVAYIHWDTMWGDEGGAVTVQFPWDKSRWTTTKGYVVNPVYHGLRHFTRFVPRGYKRTAFVTDHKDVVVCPFVSPDGGTMTVVLINKGGMEHEVTLAVDGLAAVNGQLHTTLSGDAKQASKAKGQISTAEPLVMPAKSIATVVLDLAEALPVEAVAADADPMALRLRDGSLDIASDAAMPAVVEVWDVCGRSVATLHATLAHGNTTVALPPLPSGTLFVKATRADGRKAIMKTIVH